jgi:hypothetical protein
VVEESLLTEDVRAHIGKTADRGLARVTPQALLRASETYFGAPWEPAPAHGEPVPGIVVAALETESFGLEMPSVMPNSLLISNEWQFERQLRMGEELEVQARLADISERFGGRFGYSLYFRSEVEFREPGTDTVVARSSQTMMQYDAASAAGGGDEE